MKIVYNNILIIKMSSFGDIIHALPTLPPLRALYPAARISWLVEPQFAGLLPGAPYIDDPILFRKNDLKKMSWRGKFAYLAQLRRQLREKRFDLVIDLQGLLKSSLVALLSGCSNRIGYWEMREGSFLVTRGVKGPHWQGHVVQRYLDVVRYLGARVDTISFPLPDLEEEKDKMRELLAREGVSERFAVFFPASRWATKEWPTASYAALAERLADAGLFVLLAGAAADSAKAHMIKRLTASTRVRDFTGQTNIRELAGLVSLAAVCVGGDTGPMHVAAAAGVPTLSLFGPVSGARTSAYGPLSRVISAAAPCAPCFKRVCPRPDFICMPSIGVEEVWTACSGILAGEA
jgi:heptosyltransferase-1/heptosyltransferase-2